MGVESYFQLSTFSKAWLFWEDEREDNDSQTKVEKKSLVLSFSDDCQKYRLRHFVQETARECRRTGSRNGIDVAWVGVVTC